jgi:hypothetical protein
MKSSDFQLLLAFCEQVIAEHTDQFALSDTAQET